MKDFTLTTSEVVTRVMRYTVTAEDEAAARAALEAGNYGSWEVVSEDVESCVVDEVEES